MATKAEVHPDGPTIIIKTDDPGWCCCNRDFEWWASLALVGIGLTILASPGTVESGAFRYIMHLGLGVFDDYLWFTYILIGGVRVVALIVNGNWPRYGPHLRAVGCLISAFVWAAMTMALLRLHEDTHQWSIGVPAWGLAIIFELLSLYRAVGDVGNNHQ